MAYQLSRLSSFDTMRTYTTRVIAGLEAAAQTPEVVVRWRQEKAAITEKRNALEADLDREVETSERVSVCDVQWDEAVGETSRISFALSGSDSKKPPYVDLFGHVKADDLKRMNSAKAVVAAASLLDTLRRIGHPGLAEATGRLEERTRALAAAEEADAAAEAKLTTYALDRVNQIRRLERLVAETELAILTANPGRNDLVRAILSPNPRKPAQRADEPATPPEG